MERETRVSKVVHLFLTGTKEMLVLRRTARNYVPWITSTRAGCAKSDIPSSISKHIDGHHGRGKLTTKGFDSSTNLYYEHGVSAKLILGCRSLSVQAGESTGTDGHDGLSNIESYTGSDKHDFDMDKKNSGLVIAEDSSTSNSEESESETELETELDLPGGKGFTNKSPAAPLFEVLIEVPSNSVENALEKWVEEGNLLGRSEVSFTILNLQKRRFYKKALQFVEWLEAVERLDLVEYDYASHLDLIAKVYGLKKAEEYIDKIPESFRSEVIYRTLLANCVSALSMKKAEEVFNKMRELGLPLSTFTFDKLLILYKRNPEKIADVLEMMHKEAVKPSFFTYRLLIDLKGRLHDIAGMELVVEKMRGEGMEPDIVIQCMVVGFYFTGGLKEKAEAALKEMEGYDLKKNREACKVLLRLYASLGKVDDLERVWKVCEDNLRFGEGLVAIEAWGKVGHVEKAENVFEKLVNSNGRLSAKYYDALLWVYAEHNLLSKGEALVERMKDKGCYIGPPTWGALVKLYVKAGEVEKADDMLQKARREKKTKAPYMSFLILLEEYSKRGDVQNAERMFFLLRKAGYRNMKLYRLLLGAYLNGKIPAYGFSERMKADGVFPNKQVVELLAKTTPKMWTSKDFILGSGTTQISKIKTRTLSQIFGVVEAVGPHQPS